MGTARFLATLVLLGGLAGRSAGSGAITGVPLPLDAAKPGDLNGVAVDLSGSTVIVGGSAGGVNNTKGWAQIFDRDTAGWHYSATLSSDDPTLTDGEQFGLSVAIDGDMAVVGSYKNNTVYVFQRSGTAWTENASARLRGAENSGFGIDVDISAGRILVGAWRTDAAYVFLAGQGGTWLDGTPLPASLAKRDFGYSVALSNDLAIVGDYTANTAYLYHYDGADWIEESAITRGSGSDGFGLRVDLEGQKAVVGSGRMDLGGAEDVGSASVYVRQGDGVWSEEAVLAASDGMALDEFGSSVGVFGDNVVVGARGSGPFGARSGAAYVYHFNGTSWVEVGKALPSDGGNGDQFGQAVAVGADLGVVGAWKHDSQTGAAYVIALRGAERIPGDANEDGKVDDLDASILAANWQRTGNATWATADFNGDTNVDDLDASILAANWQAGVAAVVPEPGTAVLLAGLTLTGLLWFRRRRHA